MVAPTNRTGAEACIARLAWALGVWGLLFPANISWGAVTVEEAVAANAASLAKIESIYLRSEISSGTSDQPLQKMSVSETWRSGTRVRVYYDPDQPERAVLDPQVNPLQKAGAILGTGLCLLVVIGAFLPGTRVS